MRTILSALFLLSTVWMSAQHWQTDMALAQKLAAENNLPIILVFQGSDWCAPCMKLDREVWSTDTFKSFAEDHFVMLQADFPRKRKNTLAVVQENQNKELAEKYNQQGIFPLVVVLDENGKVLGETGYKKLTPGEYIEHLNSFLK